MTRTIVFDFDGTLAVGLGPVLAYARLIAPDAPPDYLDRVEAALADFEAGTSDRRDGYDVVGTLARDVGVPSAVQQEAYLRSRGMLGTEDAPVETMPDLDGFLARLARDAALVLATNAPADGIDRVLDRWGVRERFHALHFTVGKPAGLSRIVADALARGPVLAVGDIADFDLAPASALGAQTALVGATAARSPAAVTMRGRSLADLREDIETWAASARTAPAEPTAEHPIARREA